MKRIFSAFWGTMLVIVIASGVAFAAKPQAVTFKVGKMYYKSDGSTVGMDVASFIANGSVYVPVRYLAMSLGISKSNISYDSANNTVTLIDEGKELVLSTISNNIVVDGISQVSPNRPIVKAGKLYLPARIVAETYGYKIKYNNATQTVLITVASTDTIITE